MPDPKWKIITDVAMVILKENPNGIRFSKLLDAVSEKLPDQKANTIHGTIWSLHTDYPESIYKPSKGIYKLTEYRPSDEITVKAQPEVTVANGKIAESDFYESFAQYLVEIEECTRAVALGGNKFGGKWGTPDIIGKWEPRASDIIKSPTLIIASEVKLDAFQIITAFGQACCYRLFAHKSYLVIPQGSAKDDLDKIDMLCQIHGVGLVYYDEANVADPKFRLVLRALKSEPDMYYLNEAIKKVEGELFA